MHGGDQTMSGTLYGIGVGPGDPELMTLKAVRILGQAQHVFAAASRRNSHSFALDVAKNFLPPDVPVTLLGFAMTRDPIQCQSAWRDICGQIAGPLRENKQVVFLTLGDPMTFSTFVHVITELKKIHPETVVRTVPGISCFQAAAASINLPLVVGNELFTVIPCNNGIKHIDEAIGYSDNVVFMKFHKKFPQLLENIEKFQLQDHCIFVSRCSMDGEFMESDFERIKQLTPEYMSLMIVKKPGA